MSMDPILEKKRGEILRVASRHGVGNLRVFGSRARGDSRPDSDVDLLYDVIGQTTPWFPGGLIGDLEELLGLRVDVGSVAELDEEIRDRVLREAIPL